MTSELSFPVRYYETDQMGIVHHSNYVRYFECGRNDMMRQFGLPIEEMERDGVVIPVISVEARYRMPAKMGDVLRIVTSIDKVPMAKLVVKSEIFNQNGDLLCSGNVGLGFLDAATRHPVRCPDSLAKLIEQNIDVSL